MQRLHAAADVESLTSQAAQLVAAGRIGAARPLLAAARRLAPGSVALADLGARLALRANHPDWAVQELDDAVAAAPGHAGLRKRRAELRRGIGDIEGATRDAAEAVCLDRTDPAAKALLGVLMLELGRTADAVACLAEAAAAEPRNHAFATPLATAYEAAGDAGAALDVLLHCIQANPNLTEPRNAAILLCVRRRDFRQAVRLAEDTRRAGIADACSYGLMGHALSSLGRHPEASEAYAEALKLGPHDRYVHHLVAASGVVPGAARAPVEYLRAVFDGYAERFEQHLVSLGYRMPGVFRAALGQHPRIAGGDHVGPVLDLGCGTGLVAVAIADLPVGPMIGIDVSPRMLAQAAAKGLYAELHEADVMGALSAGLAASKACPIGVTGEACPAAVTGETSPAAMAGEVPPPTTGSNGDGTDTDGLPGPAAARGPYPLILAADTFCYFGALDSVFTAAHAAMTPAGWLVCSVEELVPDHDGILPGTSGVWALLRQGRYAHSAAYIRDSAEAAGFRVLRLDRETIRHEANAPVAGLLIVLEKPPHDG